MERVGVLERVIEVDGVKREEKERAGVMKGEMDGVAEGRPGERG